MKFLSLNLWCKCCNYKLHPFNLKTNNNIVLYSTKDCGMLSKWHYLQQTYITFTPISMAVCSPVKWSICAGNLCLTATKAWLLCVKAIGDSWSKGRHQQPDNRITLPRPCPQLSCIELFSKMTLRSTSLGPIAHFLYDLWSPTQAPHHLYCLGARSDLWSLSLF